MNRLSHLLVATTPLLLLSMTAASAPAAAQSDTMQRDAPAQPADISELQIESFAVASIELQKINEKYAPIMQRTQDPNAQDQLRQEASSEMVQAVHDNGLSVQQYNTIQSLAQSDPALAAKVQEEIAKVE
jgi:hypothetical protein